MAILAIAMKENGELRKSTLVATVMSNLGLRLAMDEAGIELRTTKVGDRYVLEDLNAGGFSLGGEQSGHIVMPDHGTTGDGTLTGLALMSRMAETGLSLKSLSEAMTVLPQVLINVPVKDKTRIESAVEVVEGIERAETELGHTGRVLLRASGTEELFRVMVEAAEEETARRIAGELAAIVAKV
jgi:phosphoglucosamine mutase